MNFKEDYTGLSSMQVIKNQELYGINTDYVIKKKKDSINSCKIFLNPLFIFLTIAAVSYALDGAMARAGICTFLAIICVGFDAYRLIYLEGLHSSITNSVGNTFRVIRDEQIVLISKEELVPDDILLIQGGENIPADAFLLEVRDLIVDETILTGDSEIVPKITGIDKENEIKRTMIYSGTRAVSGTAICRVTATGMDTKRYMLHGALPIPSEYVPMTEVVARKFGLIVSILAGVIFAVVLGILFLNAIPLPKAGVFASAIAIVLSPMRICGIIRTYYIVGAMNLLKKQAIVKSLETIDNLNAMSVLCVDKTGSVTKAKIGIQNIHSKNDELLINIASLSCDKTSINPVEQAIKIYTTFQNADTSGEFNNEKLALYPFSPEQRISGNLWNIKGTNLLCIKGTPETIFPLCDFEGNDLFDAQQSYENSASEGGTVLAVAFATIENGDIPQSLGSVRYLYVGLLALSNEIKESVPFAIRQCQRSGISVKMLTGDSVETASYIGKIIGLDERKIISGYEIDDAIENDTQLDISQYDIFARITPSQKKHIISMLESSGEKVAVTGRDVSDAGYLENADIGISTIQNSTGAALDASDLLLNDDNLINISDTIKESRLIHFNIKRSASLIISLILAMIIIMSLPIIFGYEPIFSATTAGILQVIVIPLVVLSYGFIKYSSKSEITTSKYIASKRVNKRYFAKAVIQGAVIGLGGAASYLISGKYNSGAGANSFIFLLFTLSAVLLMWVNMYSLTSTFKGLSRKSTVSILISLLVILLAIIFIYLPPVARVLDFAPLNVTSITLIIALSAIFTLWWEVVKLRLQNA